MLGPGRAWLGLGHALLLALAGLGTGCVFPTASAGDSAGGRPVERAAAWWSSPTMLVRPWLRCSQRWCSYRSWV